MLAGITLAVFFAWFVVLMLFEMVGPVIADRARAGHRGTRTTLPSDTCFPRAAATS
jgi:hypothetical protein